MLNTVVFVRIKLLRGSYTEVYKCIIIYRVPYDGPNDGGATATYDGGRGEVVPHSGPIKTDSQARVPRRWGGSRKRFEILRNRNRGSG